MPAARVAVKVTINDPFIWHLLSWKRFEAVANVPPYEYVTTVPPVRTSDK
jgi:hypothetical protein